MQNRKLDNIELVEFSKEENERKQYIAGTQATAASVHALDLAALLTIYGSFLSEAGQQILEHALKPYLFPFMPVFSWLSAGLSAVTTHLERSKDENGKKYQGNIKARNAIKTGVKVAAAIAITVAIADPTPATPIIFASVGGAVALFELGSSIYNGIKGLALSQGWAEKREKHKNDNAGHEKRVNKYYDRAKQNGINAALGIANTAVVVGVFVFKAAILATLGIVTGLTGLGLAIYAGVKTGQEVRRLRKENESAQAASQEARASEQPSKRLSSTAEFGPTLGLSANQDKLHKNKKAEVEEVEALLSQKITNEPQSEKITNEPQREEKKYDSWILAQSFRW